MIDRTRVRRDGILGKFRYLESSEAASLAGACTALVFAPSDNPKLQDLGQVSNLRPSLVLQEVLDSVLRCWPFQHFLGWRREMT